MPPEKGGILFYGQLCKNGLLPRHKNIYLFAGYFMPAKKSSRAILYNSQNFDIEVKVGNFALRS